MTDRTAHAECSSSVTAQRVTWFGPDRPVDGGTVNVRFDRRSSITAEIASTYDDDSGAPD
jgi:hypothetical protein